MEERLKHSEAEKENDLRKLKEASIYEINMLKNSLQESQVRIRELEATLIEVKAEHQKAIKEQTEQLHQECNSQLDAIRSRFKLMTASTMERCPSDLSLEKIEVNNQILNKLFLQSLIGFFF